MTLKLRTIFLSVIGLTIVASLGYVAFRTEPIPVDLHAVERGSMQVTINADGKTRIREIYEIATPITGTVLRLPVRVGDQVKADETIVAVVEPSSSDLLDTRTRVQAEAAVREAEAGLHQARSLVLEAEENYTLAEKEYDRALVLAERGVASVTRLEHAEQQLGIKHAALTAANSGLEMRKSALDRTRAALLEPAGSQSQIGEVCCVQIRSPADGFVLDVAAVSERPVSSGAKLMSIGQPNDLEIVADLLSSDAVRIRPGSKAIVDRWGGDDILEAVTTRVEPSAYTKVSALGIEEQRVDVLFDIVSVPEKWADLGDGFSVFLRVVEWEGEGVLTVPVSSIFQTEDGWAVYVFENSVARLKNIKTGKRNETVIQVLEGLNEGERVITYPSEQIVDGSLIAERAAK